MKAVIVAAGESSRLRPLTDSLPKCLLPLNGKPLVEYAIENLQLCGISEIAFVVGYQKDKLRAGLGSQFEYIFNPFYKTTNNLASLWFAKDYIGEQPFVYCHSDLLYHPDILRRTVDNSHDIALAVAKTPTDAEMMKVQVEGNSLLAMSKDIPTHLAFGEWTGIAKFTARGWQAFLKRAEMVLEQGDFNAYDAKAFTHAAKAVHIKIVAFENLPFIEIDNSDDLQRAEHEIQPRIVNRW